MASSYFEKITVQARQIDEGIQELTKIWEMPEIVIGGYKERTEVTNGYIEDLQRSLSNIQHDIEEILSQSSDDVADTYRFLEEAESAYNSWKNDIDSIETILEEYNYGYDLKDDITEYDEERKLNDQTVPTITSSSPLSEQILTSDQKLSSTHNSSVNLQRSYATPMRERPPDPVFSKYFYDILKK